MSPLRLRLVPDRQIGHLRHRIIIQKATETQDSDGSVIQSWSNYLSANAEIIPISGSEDYVAQGLSASVIYAITIRYQAGIIPKMRVLWGDRTFEIATVRNIDERGRWTVMNCEESV